MIKIQKLARKTAVYVNDNLAFLGGRVEAKRFAKEEAEKTNLPLFNVKDSGKMVRV